MSQIRKRSSKDSPSKLTPSSPRTSATGAGARHGIPAPTVTAGRGVAVTATPSVRLVEAGDLVAPALLDQGLRGDGLVEDLLGAGLRDVDEGRERGSAGVGEVDAEELLVPVEGAARSR